MTNYQKIPRPKKIVLVRDTNIFYIDSEGDLRVFDLNRIIDTLDPYARRTIENNLQNVKADLDGFIWEADHPMDEVYIDPDTITAFSQIISPEDLAQLTLLLSQKKEYFKKLTRALSSIL